LRSQLSWSTATGEKVLEAGIVYVAVIFAGGFLIRHLTRNLTAGIKKLGETAEQVENAGRYIGWLERFLVVIAILVQSPSMVGLILYGKVNRKISGVERTICENISSSALSSVLGWRFSAGWSLRSFGTEQCL
jgi:hypothetical protein